MKNSSYTYAKFDMNQILEDKTSQQILKMYYYNLLVSAYIHQMSSNTIGAFLHDKDFKKINVYNHGFNFLNTLGYIVYDPFSSVATNAIGNKNTQKSLKEKSDRLMSDTFTKIHKDLTVDKRYSSEDVLESLRIISLRFDIRDKTSEMFRKNLESFGMQEQNKQNDLLVKLYNTFTKIDKHSPLLEKIKKEFTENINESGEVTSTTAANIASYPTRMLMKIRTGFNNVIRRKRTIKQPKIKNK